MNESGDDLDALLSVAAAKFDSEGVLLAANKGFLRLIGESSGQRIGTACGQYLVQPNFTTFAATSPGKIGELYCGLITIGEYMGTSQTLRGRVWRTVGGLRILAEHDVEELERIVASMQELAQDSLLSQRTLGVENTGLKRREAQMVETTLLDALTGVGNRRKLDQALASEIARAERTGQPLCALMADIDHFKQVNDGYGHAAGDRVLARFGELLRMQTRPSDIVTRFGGEEFVVLMPHTALAPALAAAERIRSALANERIDPLADPVTTSFGVAQLSGGENAESLLGRIDAALYRAKESGRNRVVASAP
ncbi:MAG: GGDEF domain-containing protein [Usitatibacter sp.]